MKIIKQTANAAPIIVIYGEEGAGKTTLASTFKNSVVFLFEQGIPRGIVVDAIEGATSFDATMSLLNEIFKDPQGYRTVVIDTGDALEALVIQATCQQHNLKSIEQLPYGRGYYEASGLWRRILNALATIRNKHGITIVITCHAIVERIDDPRVPSYTSYQLRLHRRTRSLLMDAADCVFFLGDDLRVVTESTGFGERNRGASDTKRYLFTERRPAFAAKNRFSIPSKIQIGAEFDISDLTKYWETPHESKNT
jgi:AAA domain